MATSVRILTPEAAAEIYQPLGSDGTVQDQIDAAVTTHVNAPEPHPAYDDIQDLAVLFENGLV